MYSTHVGCLFYIGCLPIGIECDSAAYNRAGQSIPYHICGAATNRSTMSESISAFGAYQMSGATAKKRKRRGNRKKKDTKTTKTSANNGYGTEETMRSSSRPVAMNGAASKSKVATKNANAKTKKTTAVKSSTLTRGGGGLSKKSVNSAATTSSKGVIKKKPSVNVAKSTPPLKLTRANLKKGKATTAVAAAPLSVSVSRETKKIPWKKGIKPSSSPTPTLVADSTVATNGDTSSEDGSNGSGSRTSKTKKITSKNASSSTANGGQGHESTDVIQKVEEDNDEMELDADTDDDTFVSDFCSYTADLSTSLAKEGEELPTTSTNANRFVGSRKRKCSGPEQESLSDVITATTMTINATTKKCKNAATKSVDNVDDDNDHDNGPLAEIVPVPDALENSLSRTKGVKIVTAKIDSIRMLDKMSQPTNAINMDSTAEGQKIFGWLLDPLSVDDFFHSYWESSACLIKRNQTDHFRHLISFKTIDQMLLNNYVEFTKNIDVTSYQNGCRVTLNPEGRAMPPVVWDFYGNGCSIRLLNPQTFLPSLHSLCATLQEYFHCLVGVNAYLTPPGSQGFAPHYDDIEAFVLQIEGRKRWKLYKPLSSYDELPRVSSRNLQQHEIGEARLEEVLQPGDILYMPRGIIHQASTDDDSHSLHLTVSVYQKQAFIDLLEHMMPLLLQQAAHSSRALRRGLPLHMWRNFGAAFNGPAPASATKERTNMIQHVMRLFLEGIGKDEYEMAIDAATDQLAKRFQHEALPPKILPVERQRTIFGSRSYTGERGECLCNYDILLSSRVRLLRANILRLVEEDGKMLVYYYLDNSMEYCEHPANFLEIEPDVIDSVKLLLNTYPEYVDVARLPLPDDERKITIATVLWERGLLMTEKTPFH